MSSFLVLYSFSPSPALTRPAEMIGVIRFRREWSRTSLRAARNLDVLDKALRDLPALGVVGEILEAQNFALAGQRKLRIEGGPVDLVAEFDAGQRNGVRVKSVEEALKGCFGELGVSKRERMASPHSGELIGLIGPRGRVGRIFRADDQLDANAPGGGALGKIDALIVVRDAAADDPHRSGLELVEESVLIGETGAHWIDHVDAYDHLLRSRHSGREKEDRDQKSRSRPASLHAVHLFSRMMGARLIETKPALAMWRWSSPCKRSGDRSIGCSKMFAFREDFPNSAAFFWPPFQPAESCRCDERELSTTALSGRNRNVRYSSIRPAH